MQWHWILPNVLEVEGHWITQMSIAYFLSNSEEGSVLNKSSYTGQLCLASAVVSVFSARCFSWTQWSLQGKPGFRGAFSLEMFGFHRLNRKGVGNPVELRHLNNTFMWLWVLLKYSHFLRCCLCVCVAAMLILWLMTLVCCVCICIIFFGWTCRREEQQPQLLSLSDILCWAWRFVLCHHCLKLWDPCSVAQSICNMLFKVLYHCIKLNFFFCCLLNDPLAKWVLSILKHQSAYLQDSVLLQHYT